MRTIRNRVTGLIMALLLLVGTAACQDRIAGAESSPQAETVVATFHVEGMTCGGCEAGVKMKVKKLEGVHSVDASHEEKKVEVAYDPTLIGVEKIGAAIKDLGYEAELPESDA